jgi:hypothetical protein
VRTLLLHLPPPLARAGPARNQTYDVVQDDLDNPREIRSAGSVSVIAFNFAR